MHMLWLGAKKVEPFVSYHRRHRAQRWSMMAALRSLLNKRRPLHNFTTYILQSSLTLIYLRATTCWRLRLQFRQAAAAAATVLLIDHIVNMMLV